MAILTYILRHVIEKSNYPIFNICPMFFFSDFPSIRYRLGYGLAWLALNGGNEGLAREYMDIAISDATEPEDIDIFEELFSKQ